MTSGSRVPTIGEEEHSAAAAILELEQRYTKERSKFVKKKLLEKIGDMKKIYNKILGARRPPVPRVDGKAETRLGSDVRRAQVSPRKKIVAENCKGSAHVLTTCDEAVVRFCRDIKVSNLECKNSLVLEELRDSTIQCSAHQIRMLNCKNVFLECFSETGIFLENCSQITVRGASFGRNSHQNEFRSIYDLTDPFEAVNYRIVE